MKLVEKFLRFVTAGRAAPRVGVASDFDASVTVRQVETVGEVLNTVIFCREWVVVGPEARSGV